MLPITEPYGLFSIQIQTTCMYVGVVVTRPHGSVGEDGAATGEDGAATGADGAATGAGGEATGNGGDVVAVTVGVACAMRADADGGEVGVLLDPASWRALAVQAASVVTVNVTTASCRTAGLATKATVATKPDSSDRRTTGLLD
ncbi:MAG TPA: hypothetical protein VGL75_13930 [Acidothermaceae bacterium]